MEPDLFESLTRTIRWLVVATAVLYLILAAVGAFVYRDTRDTLRKNATARLALCAFRGDLEQRIKSSQDFLDSHPAGFDGVKVTVIQSALISERQTLQSLDPLRCH